MFRGLHTGPLCSDETHLRTHRFLLGHTLQALTRRVPARLLQSGSPRSKTHPPTLGPLLQGRHLSELQTSLSFLVYTSLRLTVLQGWVGGLQPSLSSAKAARGQKQRRKHKVTAGSRARTSGFRSGPCPALKQTDFCQVTSSPLSIPLPENGENSFSSVGLGRAWLY